VIFLPLGLSTKEAKDNPAAAPAVAPTAAVVVGPGGFGNIDFVAVTGGGITGSTFAASTLGFGGATGDGSTFGASTLGFGGATGDGSTFGASTLGFSVTGGGFAEDGGATGALVVGAVGFVEDGGATGAPEVLGDGFVDDGGETGALGVVGAVGFVEDAGATGALGVVGDGFDGGATGAFNFFLLTDKALTNSLANLSSASKFFLLFSSWFSLLSSS